jgi:hypothetical protein
MSINSILMGLSNLGCAAVVIAVAIPLVKGRVKMNQWYGVRIKKAFVSEDNWYKINAYGGRRLIFWSCMLALIGVITFFIPIEAKGPEVLLTMLPLGLAPLLVMIPAIIEIYRFSNRL